MQAIEVLSQPAQAEWSLARVAALLLPYYNADTPQSVRMMEAEDWVAALGGFPQWAVDAAARWWKSDANPKRHKRPVEGDIVARCKAEMGLVKYAQFRVREFDGEATDFAAQLAKREGPCSPDAAAEIMARAGFKPTSMEVDQ